jgi:hypothetical protein
MKRIIHLSMLFFVEVLTSTILMAQQPASSTHLLHKYHGIKNALVDSDASRDDLAISKRLRLWEKVNSDIEYNIDARYILSKYLSASTHYDSDMGYGIELTFTY